MGSRVIGFRVPDDLAEELERISGERGVTTAEFLRKLVDDTLYPSNREQTAALADASLEEQINRLEDAQSWLTDESASVSKQVEELSKQVEELEANNILSPEQMAVINDMANLASRVKEMEKRQDKMNLVLDQNTSKVQGALTIAQDYMASAGNNIGKLQSEINTLRTKLETITSFPSKFETLKSDFIRLSDRLSTIERRVKQKPTDKTEKIELTDGRGHTFRVYKGTNGLVKPHRIAIDPISGDKYIDLSEPLD